MPRKTPNDHASHIGTPYASMRPRPDAAENLVPINHLVLTVNPLQ